jgi:hypothetical protein
MRARSFPLTCTTNSMVDVVNAVASTAIQDLVDQAVACPNSRHSVWVTCGMMGDNDNTAMSSASCATLRSCGSRCIELGQRIQQFHDRGDRRVEGAAAADIVGHLARV